MVKVLKEVVNGESKKRNVKPWGVGRMRVEDFGGKEKVKGIIKLSKQTTGKGIKFLDSLTLFKRPPTKLPPIYYTLI